jgi:glycogen(starch) synthase
VSVVTLALSPSPAPSAAPDGLGSSPVRVHRVGSAVGRLPGLHQDPRRPFHPPVADPVVRRHVARLLAHEQPDVVHAHNWMVQSVPPGRHGVVLTAHDYALACPKRTLLDDAGAICDGPALRRCAPCSVAQYGPAKAVAIDVATRIGRRTLSVDAVVAVSEAVAAAVRPRVRAPVRVIPNFVPSGLGEAPGLPVPGLPDGPFAFFAGDVAPHKGAEVLRRAWQDRPPCPLVVASLRGGELRGSSVVAVGTLTPGQMATAWRQASVAVVPSQWADPCPTVALEALTFGVPVVASAVGGLTDILAGGRHGILVPPGDPVALRAAVATVVDNPARHRVMADAARCHARRYAASAVVPQLVELYRQVVADRGEVRGR